MTGRLHWAESHNMPHSGIYQLFIHLPRPTRISIGRLGSFTFPSGTYAYTGSAKRNLEARLRRHLSSHKKLRWHIDNLLAAPAANIKNIAIYPWQSGAECQWNQWLQRHAGGQPIIKKFGASDCRSACGSHLLLLQDSSSGPPALPSAAITITVK